MILSNQSTQFQIDYWPKTLKIMDSYLILTNIRKAQQFSPCLDVLLLGIEIGK